MNERIDELQKEYREIKAPQHLATRIRAEVAERPDRSHSWMPAGATVMAIALVAWLAPLGEQQTGTSPTMPSKPSVTAIAALMPDSPATVSVSLSQLKTAKKPKMPPKPRPASATPRTNLESETDLLEETTHELI